MQINKVQNTNIKSPSFGYSAAGTSAFTNLLAASERYPMFDVSIKDFFSAIGPRTAEDSMVNAHYGMETFRRESSGLVQNCLLPSFYALGVGAILQWGIFGTSGMASLWASEKNINLLAQKWNEAQGEGAQKARNYVKNILGSLEGLSGDSSVEENWKKFSTLKKEDYERVVDDFAKIITDVNMPRRERKKLFNEGVNKLVEHTKAEEIIRFADKEIFGSNLRTLVRDMNDLGKRFVKHGTFNPADVNKFSQKAIKLLNNKSFIAMPLILAVSFSLQPINRLITKKQSGLEGAPIYKDYADDRINKAKVEVDKTRLFVEKTLASALMFLTAWASTGFKGFSKDMFQFKGWTPTMDQCRWISATTFTGRIWASEDHNDFGLTTARDIATFASFYFLGDFIAKGFAAAFDKNKEMFNITGHAQKHDNFLINSWRQTRNWLSNYKLKTFAEAPSAYAKNLRAVSQVANLGLTTLILGFGITKLLNKKTEESRIEDLKKAGIPSETIKDNYPLSLRGRIKDKALSVGIYNSFFTGQN